MSLLWIAKVPSNPCSPPPYRVLKQDIRLCRYFISMFLFRCDVYILNHLTVLVLVQLAGIFETCVLDNIFCYFSQEFFSRISRVE